MEQTKLSKIDLNSLVKELESQNLLKRDLVVPSTSLKMVNGNFQMEGYESDDEKLSILLANTGVGLSELKKIEEFDILPSCHNQISSKLGIPKTFYDRLGTQYPDILDYNVTELLQREQSNYFLRTFSNPSGSIGIARAFLSDKFKTIDNLDVLMSALEAIRASGQRVFIESADLTDNRMYVRFMAPDVIKSAPELLKNYRVPNGNNPADSGYGICSGFILSNSETGHATFTISPRFTVLACRNGMIRHEDKLAQKHLGSKMEVGEITWSMDTKQKELELIQSQVKDAVTTYLDQEYFGKAISDIMNKGNRVLEHPVDAIGNIGAKYNISEDRKKELLGYFIQGCDTSAFGAIQALTYLAHEVEPEMRYDLESASVEVLDNMDEYDRPMEVKSGSIFNRN